MRTPIQTWALPPDDDVVNFPYRCQPTMICSKSETIANLKRRPCRIRNLFLLNRHPITFYATTPASTNSARRYGLGVGARLDGGIDLWRDFCSKDLEEDELEN